MEDSILKCMSNAKLLKVYALQVSKRARLGFRMLIDKMSPAKPRFAIQSIDASMMVRECFALEYSTITPVSLR